MDTLRQTEQEWERERWRDKKSEETDRQKERTKTLKRRIVRKSLNLIHIKGPPVPI